MNWTIKLIRHRGENRIAFFFPYDQEEINKVRKIEGVAYSKSHKCWYINDTPSNRKKFNIPLKIEKNPDHVEKIESFRRWLRSRRYSASSVKTYTEALGGFLFFFNDRPIDDFEVEDLIRYNNDYILAKKLSHSYQNQVVNAIKLFFRSIEHKKMNPDLFHRPKREKTLPNVLSKEEVKKILEAHSNIKHRTMLCLIYSCGLRCGELLKLMPSHIDSNRQVIIIKQAKGRKDRIAPLSGKIVELLRVYYKLFKPEKYLFEGQQKGEPYDSRSLQQVLKSALYKTGIKKPVTLHWLRHSYATHLLENGTDLRYIQEILGHKSSRTTEIYTHVSTHSIQKIISPFDFL